MKHIYTATSLSLKNGTFFDCSWSYSNKTESVYAWLKNFNINGGQCGLRIEFRPEHPDYHDALAAYLLTKDAKPLPPKEEAEKAAPAPKEQTETAAPAPKEQTKKAAPASKKQTKADAPAPKEQTKKAAPASKKQETPKTADYSGKGWKIYVDEAAERIKVSLEKRDPELEQLVIEGGFWYSSHSNTYNKRINARGYMAAAELAKKLPA